MAGGGDWRSSKAEWEAPISTGQPLFWESSFYRTSHTPTGIMGKIFKTHSSSCTPVTPKDDDLVHPQPPQHSLVSVHHQNHSGKVPTQKLPGGFASCWRGDNSGAFPAHEHLLSMELSWWLESRSSGTSHLYLWTTDYGMFLNQSFLAEFHKCNPAPRATG